MREYTLKLSFTDLGALASPTTYNPPHDGRGLAINELSDWSQTISLSWRSGANLAGPDVTAGSTDYIRATVTIKRGTRTILTTGWLVPRRTSE